MIETGATMEDDECRLLAHGRSIKCKLRTDHIKENALPVDRYKHGSAIPLIREPLELHERNICTFIIGNRPEKLPLRIQKDNQRTVID